MDKFLKITIHDNDFTNSLQYVSQILQKIFIEEGKFPDEENLEMIKPLVANMWYSIHEICSYMRWTNRNEQYEIKNSDNYKQYFIPELSIVNYIYIPDWDNYESCYIPLFKYDYDLTYPNIITV